MVGDHDGAVDVPAAQVVHGAGRDVVGACHHEHELEIGLAIADEVGEVAHLLGHDVAGGEIAAGEQLAEVQTVRR